MMTEWTVVGVVIALMGFAAAIVGPVVKLNTSITKLTVTMDALASRLVKIETDNHDSHKRLWRHNDEQDAVLNDHEHRIKVMEGK